jgi:hypothetical protein
MKIRNAMVIGLIVFVGLIQVFMSAHAAEITGVTVTPHVVAESMRFRRPRDPEMAAKVQIFVKGAALPGLFNGKKPADLLQAKDWAWHDLNTAIKGESQTISVWTFNGRSSSWGLGQSFEVEGEGLPRTRLAIDSPKLWISSISFPGEGDHPQPRRMFIHIVSSLDREVEVQGVRFWLPKNPGQYQTLYRSFDRPVSLKIPADDRGLISLRFDENLPLSYAAIEVMTSAGVLWEHLRIKSDNFDISGGWTGDNLRHEPYLRLLANLHVNCGQIERVPGYSDNKELQSRYPMKVFNRLMPLEQWDRDEMLSKIHAVEFLGEPQYGGGRPVLPQEVFEKFLPYRISRLATSVTHSEERIWRYYAGLSDFPHYDAYRVVAPAADSWREYDRWDGKRITWGAPLETIGDMCRSLRENNRPMPVAFWSQGPHDGWSGGFRSGGRSRRSPTPDELRSQAMHALSTRITSLYWFNLSLKSLMKYPDTWVSIQRIGREIKMLSPFYLAGDAGDFQRTATAEGKPDWDFSTIVAPDCAILFANDIAYQPDATENVFKFGEPRSFSHNFRLPNWLRGPVDVFRIDADGITEVSWKNESGGIRIDHKASRDAIFIAARSVEVRRAIESRRLQAIAWETQNKPSVADLDALKALTDRH